MSEDGIMHTRDDLPLWLCGQQQGAEISEKLSG